jgi:CheY-like chemotaxis protein
LTNFSDPSWPRPLVLIADPDRDSRDLYGEWFHANGFDVVQAANGRDALAKALERTPSLVVTETWLPELDGVELCRELRQRQVTSEVPIIVVTADATRTTVERAHRAGANAVLVKPADIQALEDTLFSVRLEEQLNRAARARHDASMPAAPPALSCPNCGHDLQCELVDGVDAGAETWERYSCRQCGRHIEYGQTTRKLRQKA